MHEPTLLCLEPSTLHQSSTPALLRIAIFQIRSTVRGCSCTSNSHLTRGNRINNSDQDDLLKTCHLLCSKVANIRLRLPFTPRVHRRTYQDPCRIVPHAAQSDTRKPESSERFKPGTTHYAHKTSTHRQRRMLIAHEKHNTSPTERDGEYRSTVPLER